MLLRLPDRRRVASFALALAVEALLLIALLTFGPRLTPATKPVRPPSTFSLIPSTEDASTGTNRRAAKQTAKTSSGAATPQRPPSVPAPTAVPTPWDGSLPGVLRIDLGAKNISKLKSSAPPAIKSDQDQTDSQLAEGRGFATGGQSYSIGDWYRLPTRAEVGPYLPKRTITKGWGLILCKTAPRYHVEDCHIVGESPAGSGLGRATLNMSWQFLIRPSRRNGQALIGSPIGVKFELTTNLIAAEPRATDAGDGPSDDDK